DLHSHRKSSHIPSSGLLPATRRNSQCQRSAFPPESCSVRRSTGRPLPRRSMAPSKQTLSKATASSRPVNWRAPVLPLPQKLLQKSKSVNVQDNTTNVRKFPYTHRSKILLDTFS